MRLSNVLKNNKEDSTSVLNFVPRQFSLETAEQAKEFLRNTNSESQFRMSDVIKQQTGVDQVEAAHFEERVEVRTLEKLKDVQEGAYQEAYQLGQFEGEKRAFKENSEIIKEKLAHFEQVLGDLEKMKLTLLQYNETHIIELLLHLASRLAFFEIKSDPTVIKEILQKALDMAQLEEKLTVHLSPADYEFITKLRAEEKDSHKSIDSQMQKLQLEQSDEVTSGGCVLETNYGTIDAKIEERVSQLWEIFEEKLSKVKDIIRAA